ncbi:hypothetical protein D3C71_2055900 [compost metagenome]
MAAKAASTMEAMERKMTICCQSWVMGAKVSITRRTISVIAATLGAMAKKAVTGVGAPS